MKIDNIKITQHSQERSEDSQRLNFSIVEPEATSGRAANSGVTVRTRSMMVKIGLCAAAVVLAFVLRIAGIERPSDDDSVQSAATQEDEDDGDENTLGTLHFVNALEEIMLPYDKWSAPVTALDVELIRDSQIIRFTADNDSIFGCLLGEVITIGEDVRYGRYVRLRHSDNLETIYYGFDEIGVSEGNIVQTGAVLGTIERGRSVYMQILHDGEPQNPTSYVNINIGG